jgi:alpha-D-ribose 1-methylphosphonate 5-triphosphate synthase subunit PhnH
MLPGLADPTLDSQRAFRSVLDAMSHPGRIVELTGAIQAPAPLHPATALVCLALLDLDTPLWLDGAASRPEVREWLRFHCGVPLVGRPQGASFALLADPLEMPPLADFDGGTAEHPDRSATLVIQVQALLGGTGRRLTGPGIEREARLDVVGVPDAFWTGLDANHALFPRGVDVVASAGRVIAALPRTTRVEG